MGGKCRANGAIDRVSYLHRIDDAHDVIRSDVFEEDVEIDFLLVVAAECHRRGLADDREDRRVIALCIVEPIEEMNSAGAGRC